MTYSEHRTPSDIAIRLHRRDATPARSDRQAGPGATADDAGAPAIVLCHGFCGIQDLLLPPIAERLVAAGYTVVTFDYRGFGESGGERGRLVPAMQIDDIRAVVHWLRGVDGVDPERIGLWGTSLGGCHVIAVAAGSPDIACVVSQLPFADGEAVVTGNMTAEEKSGLLGTLNKMEERRASTAKEMLVPVTKVLTDPESKEFFERNRTLHPAIDIRIPFLTVREMLGYRPVASAGRVTCPTLIVVAENDTVNPAREGTALFDAIGASARHLHVEPAARHYDIYDGQPFENVIGAEIAWFDRHLGRAPARPVA